MKLTGVIPPIGTPLCDDDKVDEVGLRRLVRHLVDAGVHGILANASMGGFAFLTDEEQARVVSIVVSEVGGAVPVLGGLGETSTSRAVRKAKRIAREGVSYISVLPPFYYVATQEHLVSYFSDIATAVDLPLLLYDNPSLTKCAILPETVAELRRRIPRIVGIKESNQDCANLQNLLNLFKDDPEFSILFGTELLIVVGLQMGCDGCVGGLHNICPGIAVDLYEAFRSGELSRARERQQQLTELSQIFRYGAIWGGFDEALRYLDICVRATGAPYISKLTEEETKKVHEILDRQLRPHLHTTSHS